MTQEAAPKTAFLNVDLDLRTDSEIDSLLTAFNQSIFILNQNKRSASVELSESYSSLEDTILGFIRIIRTLPPSAGWLWNRCTLRNLNIGIQAQKTPCAAEFSISNETMILAGGLGLGIVLTVYSPEK